MKFVPTLRISAQRPRCRWQRFAMSLGLLWPLVGFLAMPSSALAADVQAPHPLEFANLSAARQDVIRESVHRQLMAATPEERMRYRIAVRLAIEKLTPDERRRLSEQTVQRWNQLTPEQHRLIEERKQELLNVMGKDERQQAIEQRRLLLQVMPSGEQKDLEKPLRSR